MQIRSASAYREMLAALLPRGLAWPRDPDSVLGKLLLGLAAELARVDGRTADLVDEAYPPAALESLAEWETMCGLPDECTGSATTLQERRARVVAALAATGGQSRSYFLSLAAILGYEVDIQEYRPFIAGLSRCGDQLNGGAEVRHFWRVVVAGPRVTWFRCGASQCGDKLGSIAHAEDMECLFNRLKPAQTQLIVSYLED